MAVASLGRSTATSEIGGSEIEPVAIFIADDLSSASARDQSRDLNQRRLSAPTGKAPASNIRVSVAIAVQQPGTCRSARCGSAVGGFIDYSVMPPFVVEGHPEASLAELINEWDRSSFLCQSTSLGGGSYCVCSQELSFHTNAKKALRGFSEGRNGN